MDTPSPQQLERQQKDWREKNVQAIARMAEGEHKSVEQLDAFEIRSSLQFTLRCTQCGTLGISSRIIHFFKNNGAEIKCYKCQFRAY